MGTAFGREIRTYCGKEYMDVELFRYSDERERAAKRPRRRREKITLPKQARLNEKKARRLFEQILKANFTGKDYHVTLTYDRWHLPETIEDGEKQVRNYIRRANRRRTKQGLPPMRYVLITEGVTGKNGQVKRLHHHLVAEGGLSRDEMEELWSLRGKRIGYANADRLQPDEAGLTAIAKYLTKEPAGKKRWSCSRNLIRPGRTAPNDSKYSPRKLEKICRDGEIWLREWWEKQYPGWTVAGDPAEVIEATPPDEYNGWGIYARLRKKDIPGKKRRGATG